MAVMKTLYTEMTDPVNFLENDTLDHYRMQAWKDAIDGLYLPENYSGENLKAYRVGRQQIEMFCADQGIDLFNKPRKTLVPTLEQELNDPHNEWGTWGSDGIDPTLTGTFEWQQVSEEDVSEEFFDPDEDYIEGRM